MDSGPLVQANTPTVREMQPAGVGLGRPIGPRVYPELISQESALGEYVRGLMKRNWTVLACLFTIFSVVAIASLKMTPVYEASGSIAINKPDSGLVNFDNSPTFNLDCDSPIQASDWLSKQLVDLKMKVETSQEKLVRYQREHEILGIDEKQKFTTAKLDDLNKPLPAAESERMDKESVYRLVQSG